MHTTGQTSSLYDFVSEPTDECGGKIRLERFRAEDYFKINEQEHMKYLGEFIKLEDLKRLEDGKYNYSIFNKDRVVMCGGLIQFWKNRGEIWAVVDKDCKKEFYAIHKIVKRFLDVCPLKRIEATVDYSFLQGHRWIRMLGFSMEARLLKSYFPNGRDASLYALVR